MIVSHLRPSLRHTEYTKSTIEMALFVGIVLQIVFADHAKTF